MSSVFDFNESDGEDGPQAHVSLTPQTSLKPPARSPQRPKPVVPIGTNPAPVSMRAQMLFQKSKEIKAQDIPKKFVGVTYNAGPILNSPTKSKRLSDLPLPFELPSTATTVNDHHSSSLAQSSPQKIVRAPALLAPPRTIADISPRKPQAVSNRDIKDQLITLPTLRSPAKIAEPALITTNSSEASIAVPAGARVPKEYVEGDFVYVADWWNDACMKEFARFGLPHICVIEKIIKTATRDEAELRYLYRPHETFHQGNHRFFLREVLLSSQRATRPLTSLRGLCHVLHVSDYRKSSVVDFPEEHTYVCQCRYSPDSKAIAPAKAFAVGRKLPLQPLALDHTRPMQLMTCGDQPIAPMMLGSSAQASTRILLGAIPMDIVFVKDCDVPVHIRHTAVDRDVRSKAPKTPKPGTPSAAPTRFVS
jgi:hypothetical protein